ncbi:DUF917 domain-containing protein [Janthinobacterium sp. BJB401]|uniref:DUF917 domain-containing protein n=1 Tax=Janthinobacterium sp. BJB401 TaxID=2745934 RepID=UPI00159545E7|nr:DUF917 domain-containing protein [Janthinobacterium sp. BJB401]NVI81723.1 DUF917 domain-containing protein [Janthinobacterium sp. BJB401]
MSYVLNHDDLESLLLGACFFGSGGGGTLTSARSLLAQFHAGDYYPDAQVRVVSVDEATEGETVMVAYLGSPVAINGAQFPQGPVDAVIAVRERLALENRTLAYLAPPESGALGFLVACLVAAHLGLAVIDADGAGRAVPSLPQLTYAAEQINPRPAFLVSQSGLRVELDVQPSQGVNGAHAHQQDVATIIDQMMRPIVSQADFKQFGGLAMWIMAPAELARALPVRGTLGRALRLGRELQAGRLRSADELVDYLARQCDMRAWPLFPQGTFVTAEVDSRNGFDLGKITIRAGERLCTVLYQNESLLAWDSSSSTPLCMAPDTISYFVEGDGQAVYSNGDLLLPDGTLNPALLQRKVTLLGLQAHPALRERGGLILDSFMQLLNTIGYLGPYVPLAGNVGAAAGSAA